MTIWHSLPSAEARELHALAAPLQEANPEWQLAVKAMPTTSVSGRFGTADGPDAALVTLDALPDLIRDQRLMPLDASLSERDRVDFLPAAWKQVNIGNHTWGIPYELSCLGLFYRKSILATAKVGVPATTSDLQATGIAFQAKNPRQAFISLPTEPYTLLPFLWTFGGAGIQDAGWKRTTSYLLTLRGKKVAGPFHRTPGSCLGVVADGRAAMAIGAPEQLSQVANVLAQDDLGIAALPGGSPTPLTGRVWVISPKARRVEAALAAVKALSTTEATATWNAAVNRLPARLSSYESPLIRQRPALGEFRQLLSHSRPMATSDLAAVAALAPIWRPYLIGQKKLEMPKPPATVKPPVAAGLQKAAIRTGRHRPDRR